MPEPLKIPYSVATLDSVPQPLRLFFTERDGAFQLNLDGDHPDTARLSEFRQSNRSLNSAKIELEAKLATMTAELEAIRGKVANGDEASAKLAELTQQIAAKDQALRDTKLQATVASTFLALGGEARAAEYITSKAAQMFAIGDDGQLTAKGLAPDGTPLTVERWLQSPDLSWTFKPSRGGGAAPISHTATPTAPPKVSRFDVRAVGANLEAIASGKMGLSD
jgi:hypothetical protein